MKKKVRINNDKVKKLVTERLRKDGAQIHESKIDKAIKKYLLERQNFDDNDFAGSVLSFKEDTKDTFYSMENGLYDIIDDLKIIQTKEPDVLVDMHPDEIYSETYLEGIIDKLEGVIEAIQYLRSLEDEEESE